VEEGRPHLLLVILDMQMVLQMIHWYKWEWDKQIMTKANSILGLLYLILVLKIFPNSEHFFFP
jgi:hypothetical protein